MTTTTPQASSRCSIKAAIVKPLRTGAHWHATLRLPDKRPFRCGLGRRSGPAHRLANPLGFGPTKCREPFQPVELSDHSPILTAIQRDRLRSSIEYLRPAFSHRAIRLHKSSRTSADDLAAELSTCRTQRCDKCHHRARLACALGIGL